MSYNCEPNYNKYGCSKNMSVKVRNFPPGQPTQTPLPTDRYLANTPTKVAVINVSEPLIDNIYIRDGFEDIKRISRKVILTESHVTDTFLYVEGYIIKNITYSVSYDDECNSHHEECNVVKNKYKDITTKVDFHFTVPINLTGAISPSNSSLNVASYHGNCNKPCDNSTSGQLTCQRLFNQSSFLNDTFESKLEQYNIAESLFYKKQNCKNMCQYDTIVEKLELSMIISILQNQSNSIFRF